MTDHQKIVQEIIPAKLKEIEARENIRVIHCVESGSFCSRKAVIKVDLPKKHVDACG